MTNDDLAKRRKDRFDELVALGKSDADAYASWLASSCGTMLSPFALNGLAHTFGCVINRVRAPNRARLSAAEIRDVIKTLSEIADAMEERHE